jgi:glycosyltransferase involved in cell wall biosynthesis
MNNILIDKKKYPLLKSPIISVIIPIYNGGKYLHYSLRSVQNQKMKAIEIILIDDCSTDNTFRIIEKYMKEDERIRFIQNIENRKILYSKSMAALNSKGKYFISYTH